MFARGETLMANPKGGLNANLRPIIDSMNGRTLSSLETPTEKALFVRLFDEAHNPRGYNIINPEGAIIGPSLTKAGEEAKVGWQGLPTIAKSISVFEDPSITNISASLGNQHKVRSFYNNIVSPNVGNSVTSDTHNVAAALMRPLSGSSTEVMHNLGGASSSSATGISGTYPIYADALRDAADARGVLPREMQSITWEGIRGLYSPTWKRNAANQDAVGGLFDSFRSGKMGIDPLRENLLDLAGGIDDPTWYKRR
tara:strand:- start:200 stop:964 length:765 start_codon:yes stop_codon:yes gene_type:complete